MTEPLKPQELKETLLSCHPEPVVTSREYREEARRIRQESEWLREEAKRAIEAARKASSPLKLLAAQQEQEDTNI